MNCGQCGAVNGAGARFCRQCGAPLPPAVVAGGSQTRPCPRCGAWLPAVARFCSRCGAPQVPGAAPPVAPARSGGCGCGGCLVALLVIVALVAGGAFAYPPVQGLLPGLHAGDCRRITPQITSEQLTAETLTCRFGLADGLTIQVLPSREAALARLAAYTRGQRQVLATAATVAGFADRSTWQAEAAVYDVRARVSGRDVFTKDGLLLYRDRFLIQPSLVNWGDDRALQARWDELARAARQVIDARYR